MLSKAARHCFNSGGERSAVSTAAQHALQGATVRLAMSAHALNGCGLHIGTLLLRRMLPALAGAIQLVLVSCITNYGNRQHVILRSHLHIW